MKKYLTVLFALLFFTNIYAQLGWYTVANAPTSQRFEDVSFVNGTGWIAENYNSAAGGVVIHKSIDRGDTWVIMDTIKPGTQFARSVEFFNDSVGLVGMLPNGGPTAGVYRTTDGGHTFSYVNSPAFNNQAGVCGMAHFGNTVIGVGIYLGQQHFYKSIDAGLTWTEKLMDSLTLGLVDCYMFNDSIYIISGQASDSLNHKACLLKTFDGGSTWQLVALATDNYTWCWKIHFAEHGKGISSIEGSQSIFLTNDSGSTWTETFVGSCGGSPEDFGGTAFLNDTLGWVGNQYSSHCFFETRDGGATWTYYTFGQAIDRLVVLDSVTVLAVGATIYKYSFDSIATTAILEQQVNKHELTLKPNPVNDVLTIDVDLKYGSLVQLSILNTNRQELYKISPGVLQTGTHSFKFNTHDLPSGSYIVYLLTHQEHLSKKFVVQH